MLHLYTVPRHACAAKQINSIAAIAEPQLGIELSLQILNKLDQGNIWLVHAKMCHACNTSACLPTRRCTRAAVEIPFLIPVLLCPQLISLAKICVFARTGQRIMKCAHTMSYRDNARSNQLPSCSLFLTVISGFCKYDETLIFGGRCYDVLRRCTRKCTTF